MIKKIIKNDEKGDISCVADFVYKILWNDEEQKVKNGGQSCFILRSIKESKILWGFKKLKTEFWTYKNVHVALRIKQSYHKLLPML